MADAPEIKVKLTAEDTGVASAIKELTSQLKNLKKQQDETAESGLSLKKAFEGIAAAGAVLEIGKIGKEAFDSAVNIGKMADKTGITTQTLSVFHKVAGDVGASTEAVDKGLLKAASTITQFEQGSAKASKGFQLLNLTQKDFAGLNTDQKILLVTNRLGSLGAGFAKAEATRQIFGRGAGDLSLVLNSLAAQGFDKATAATAKLGLLLDQETTDAFRSAAASIQELQDVGKGMATQFEAGLLPAISDVGEALVDSLTQGGVGFKDIGKVAGDAVRGVALIFLALGQTLGTVAESIADVFIAAWHSVKQGAESEFAALSQAVHGHLLDAAKTLQQGARDQTNIVSDEVNRQKAIYAALGDSVKADYANLFPSAEEEERRKKERISRLRVPKDKETQANIQPTAPPSDAAAKAALALLNKQLEDQLAIHRAQSKQVEQEDKESYEQGLITLKDYYDHRRAEVLKDTSEETAILEKGRAAALEEANKAAAEKLKASTPKDADKQEAARLQALTKVEEFTTKITELQINSGTKIQALNTEQFKAQEENQAKILEFEKLIDNTKNARVAAAQKEIEIEKQKLEVILLQSGASKEQADAELNKFAAAKTAQVNFTESQKDGQTALKELADQRAAIEERVQSGQLFQVQGQEQIRQLEQARLPVLQQIADQLLAQAKATGDEEKIAAAEDFQKQVNTISVQANQVGTQIATIKQGIQTSLTGGITGFFNSLVQGTQSVGQAFRGLASSVISSLAQIAAQMVAQLILTKLLKSALGGFSSGGLVPGGSGGGGGGGGFADGGLIKGPGGPKSDSIPARVSAGEYIVKADAVSKFGVANLEAINRGLQIPSVEHLALPKFSEGGLVGNSGGGGAGVSTLNVGIGLDEGLVLKHLSSKAAGNIVLQHLTNNPKAASKALSRSQ
jgi:hypothetical protein